MRARSLLTHLARPARAAPLVLIAVFAVLFALAFRAGLFGLPLALILLSWLAKYAFVTFDTAARGFAEPPVLSLEMVNPASEQRPLGQLLIVGAFYGATEAAEPLLGSTAISLLRAIGLLLLPASIAVLGSSGSVLEAINPRALLATIRGLGLAYLQLWLVIVVLAGVERFAIHQYLESPFAWLPVTLAVLMYGWLALFSLIGGALYERRAELGLATWQSPEQERARQDADARKTHEKVIDELYGHWRGGAHKEALQAAQNWLAARNHALDEYSWLCERLLDWEDRRLASRLTQDFTTRLLEARRNSEALAVVRRHLDADPEFRPRTAAELIRLVNLARDAGDRALARRLLADFTRHYPNDAAAPIAQEIERQL